MPLRRLERFLSMPFAFYMSVFTSYVLPGPSKTRFPFVFILKSPNNTYISIET